MNDNELRNITVNAVREWGDDNNPCGCTSCLIELTNYVLAAIREHHAIVRLPEADYVDGCPTFWDYSLRPIPNEVVTDFGLGTEYRTTLHVNTCRALAAALLAAADAAEREQ